MIVRLRGQRFDEVGCLEETVVLVLHRKSSLLIQAK